MQYSDICEASGKKEPSSGEADIPWQVIYDLVLSCGNVHEIYAFAVKILSSLKSICAFDQGLIFFLDANGKVCNQYLLDINEKWSKIYLKYYSKIDDSFYGAIHALRDTSSKPFIRIRNWNTAPSAEFISDYIRPRGLMYSLGFTLFDVNGFPRTMFALDRTRNIAFSAREIELLSLVIPLLNNLHKNLYIETVNQYIDAGERGSWENVNLTAREIEVADLLCQGVSPANISKVLHVTKATAYKHIENIYRKMQVSSLQEFLVQLLK